MKIFRWMKSNFIFLSALLLLSLILFRPLLNYDLEVRDWYVLGNFCEDFGLGRLLFKFPPSYYLTQYGITHVSIQMLRELFGYNPLGYNIVNILSRVIASLSIYIFVNIYLGKKLPAFLSSIIFFVSYAGIETTTWISHYTNYLSVPFLLLSLYYWKTASVKPSVKLMEISLMVAAIAIIYAHLRIFALPLILILVSIYYFFINIKKRKDWGLRGKHFFIFIIIIGVFYFFTQFFKQIPAIATKIVSPRIMILFLITGVPPIIHSFFLFWGNLILPPPIVETYLYPIMGRIGIDPILTFILLTTSISMLFLLFLLGKRRFQLAILALVPIFYPIGVYLSRKTLVGWPEHWMITTMVGGTIPIIVLIFGIYLWKKNRLYSELIFLCTLITVLHLLVPWFMFHVLEGNEQSAFSFNSRYYVVPMTGVSILFGAILSLIWSKIMHSDVGFKVIAKRVLLLSIFFVIVLAFSSQAMVLNKEIVSTVAGTDAARHKQLWSMLNPYFSELENKQLKTIVYLDANELDRSIIIYRLPYQFDCEGFVTNAIVGPTVSVFSEKKEFLSQVQGSGEDVNILAFRIAGNNVENIISEFTFK